MDADGSNYLRKLKQDEQVGRARSSLTQTGRVERRATPRYKCQGSAQVQLPQSDVHTWGSIADISLHGCYIEIAATFPVGTSLELALELNGNRVETKGEVRAVYPFLGMGIRFGEMTAQDRLRLADMVMMAARELRLVVPRASNLVADWEMPSVQSSERLVEALGSFFMRHASLSRDEFTRLASSITK